MVVVFTSSGNYCRFLLTLLIPAPHDITFLAHFLNYEFYKSSA
jgi:hypothetical protein